MAKLVLKPRTRTIKYYATSKNGAMSQCFCRTLQLAYTIYLLFYTNELNCHPESFIYASFIWSRLLLKVVFAREDLMGAWRSNTTKLLKTKGLDFSLTFLMISLRNASKTSTNIKDRYKNSTMMLKRLLDGYDRRIRPGNRGNNR